MTKLNAAAFGSAGAIISAVMMLLLGILGNLGLYIHAVKQMQDWHRFFSLTPLGILGGIIEAAVVGFVLFYAFGLVYNSLCRSSST